MTTTTTTATIATRTLRVIAPSDLPPGYALSVDESEANNDDNPRPNSRRHAAARPVRVRVPDGGVKAGQEFAAQVIDDGFHHKRRSTDNDNMDSSTIKNNPHNIPVGHWRDGLFDCFTLGLCHVQCCLTWCCSWCALGQVLTRLNLSWTAAPFIDDDDEEDNDYVKQADDGDESSTSGRRRNSDTDGTISAYKILFIIGLLELLVPSIYTEPGKWTIMFGKEDRYKAAADSTSTLAYASDPLAMLSSLWNLLLFFLFFVLVMRMRSYVRHRYRIPETICAGCEDCCCAYFCAPCVICQAARHVTDYETYPADCCSETGLPDWAPHVV
jgi:Cys-rich protein (TIGR01571 family)